MAISSSRPRALAKTDLFCRVALAAAALSVLLPGATTNRWKLSYFYDKDKSSLEFRDLQCPQPATCLGAAVVFEGGKPKGALVSTQDDGAHWRLQEVKELPYSLFFLNPDTGWMVADKGIWGTSDGGHVWSKLSPLKGIERLWFFNPSHGFAVGEAETIYETADGGKNWNKVTIKTPREMEAKDIVYDQIVFSSPSNGVISGSWSPMQRAREMQWLDTTIPKRPRFQTAALLAETTDGGKTWKESEIKVQGQVARVRYVKGGNLLLLTEFDPGSEAPSELFQLASGTHAITQHFRQRSRVARDVLVLPDGDVIVASIEMQGQASNVPIPGKLRMMESTSMETWLDEATDYRAEAKVPILAAGDVAHVWVATDTGMILRRVSSTSK